MRAGPIVLVVEDSPEVAETLRELLEREGYAYEHAADGKQALAAVRRRPPDLILLDRVLPQVSGDEVLRRLRSDARCRHIPIIMLTGKSDEDDQLVGFALGADDYVSKPFSSKVLLARVAARLRGTAPADEESEAAVLGSVELDRRQPRVFVNKAAIPLTTVEYRLLAALIAAGGHVLHRSQLAAMVYGKSTRPDTRFLEREVGGLRRKMGGAAGCIQVIGEGRYAFCPPHSARPSA
jgi:two-component system phosphate regulon response regulator PhoB